MLNLQTQNDHVYKSQEINFTIFKMKSELNQIKRNTNICIFVRYFSLHALNLCEIHTCMQNCQEYYTPKNKTKHHCLSLEDEHVLFNSTATSITF